jgi:outer membrane protein TolC
VPVFSSGRVLSGRDAFKASRRAVRAGDRRETLDLKLLVAGAYVSVLRATRESQAAESVAASLALHLRGCLAGLRRAPAVMRTCCLAGRL